MTVATSSRGWHVLWFAAATLVSAFLVFQVQPLVSKTLLPWFGGSSAVWTTCMLFFQVLLLCGYAYAHLSARRLSPAWQGVLHFALLAVALWLLPITPDAGWKPRGDEQPTARILLILAVSVGFPFFVLSATGPLIQAWYSRGRPEGSPYRLYALSNAGSLAALLSYPLIIEPALSTLWQGAVWSLGFCVFALLCGPLALRLALLPTQSRADTSTGDCAAEAAPPCRSYAAWLLLPAFASIMLLATTNHVCQDVAVIPFLWVAPLSLYLVTFILCFDHPRWYSRRWYGASAVLATVGLSSLVQTQLHWNLALEVLSYFGTMFLVCMVCHGELVRGKPGPQHLTAFYLMCAAGGAAGGLVVAVICPLAFSSYLEMNLAVLAAAALAMCVLLDDARQSWLGDTFARRTIAALGYLAVFLLVGLAQLDAAKGEPATALRNFYGVLRVRSAEQARGTTLVHGRTVHGFQFRNPRLHHVPTTYYAPESGVGLTLRRLGAQRRLCVGAVGLGCGTIASYGRPGDYYRFYEINPAVLEIAQRDFTYLENCRGRWELVLGDARLSLEREAPQQFDVLVLDAFSSDAIPTHLLTREALAVYRRHLKVDGVLAIHVSNRHLQLEPVVLRLAEHCGLECVMVNNAEDPMRHVLQATWMLLTHNQRFLADEEIQPVAMRFRKKEGEDFPLWTDQYNNLFQILKVF